MSLTVQMLHKAIASIIWKRARSQYRSLSPTASTPLETLQALVRLAIELPLVALAMNLVERCTHQVVYKPVLREHFPGKDELQLKEWQLN